MRTASSARSTAPRRSDVAYLQKRLAFRMLLVSLVPLAVIAVLGVYAYRLTARLVEVEVLERSSYIDRVYKDTHNVGWAVAEYQALADQNPNNPRILVRLGAIYHRAGKHDRAIEVLSRAITLKPDEWEAHSTLAYVQLERRRFAEALEAGEAAIRLSAADMQAHNNLAWIYSGVEDERFRNLGKAVAYAERAVTSTRCRQTDYLDTLAEVYQQSGRHKDHRDTLAELARQSGRTGDAAKMISAGASSLALCERAKVASAATAGR